MRRVTGIGGIFLSARDPKALCGWYKTHLGIDVQDWGGAAFTWADAEGNPTKGTTAWSIGPADGKHFAPSTSTFMVNYRVEDLPALLAALRKHLRTESGPSHNILVVDDDPGALDVVSDTLSSAGYTPHAVSSGKDALELLSRVPINAILLDLLMPGRDGFEIAHELKRRYWNECPILIAVTGHGEGRTANRQRTAASGTL